MRRTLKRACILRPLRYREAVKTGAASEGRSYAFYRRTGDNKRSDGRLLHEKQLSPPQAALDSAAPYRGAFWSAVPPPKASPARGGGCAAGRRRRGALPVCGKNILQGPAGPCPAPVGGDACIVPETLRWRKAQAAGASPEGYSQGKVPHPSVAWGDTSPCRGGFIGGSSPKASPARGGGCATRRRRRGALPVCGGNILQGSAGPCPASVGDDARIVPETLRWRKGPAAEKPSAVTPAGSKFRW